MQQRPLTAASTSVPLPVRAASDWAWRLVAIAIAVAALVMGMVHLRTVVIPVLVATLVSSLLMPLKHWLNRRMHVPNTVSVLLTMLLALGFMGGLVTLAGRAIVAGFPGLYDRALAGVQEAVDWLSDGPLALGEETLSGYLDQIEAQLSQNAQTIVTGALSVTSSAGHVAAGTLISFFCLFFFLREGRRIWTWSVGLFPRAARERVDGAGLRSWISLGAYARTQVLVAFVDAVGIGLAAWLLGVPLPLPLGVLVFVGSFIPILGALVTGFVAVAIALFDGGIVTAALMLAAVLAVQQIEGHLLQPLLMSRAVKIHPVAVLLGVTTGTLVGGIAGALFAVPLIAVANTALRYLNGHDPLEGQAREQFADMTSRWRTG